MSEENTEKEIRNLEEIAGMKKLEEAVKDRGTIRALESMVDELTETRGRGNKESIGQGVANLVNGFFGGMGGCAMIGQSMINIRAGGRGRLSGITAALCLLVFFLFEI